MPILKDPIGMYQGQLEEKWVPKQTKVMLKAMRTYQCTINIDEASKLEDGKLDGFWMLVTNLSEKAGDAFIHGTDAVVRPYHEKVIIESSFRDMRVEAISCEGSLYALRFSSYYQSDIVQCPSR